MQDVTIHYSLSSNSLCRWTHQANLTLIIQTICWADPHHPWHLSAFFLAWKPATLCPIPWYKSFDAHRSLSRSSSTSMLESPSSHIIFIILKYHCGVTNHIPTTITTNHCIGQSIKPIVQYCVANHSPQTTNLTILSTYHLTSPVKVTQHLTRHVTHGHWTASPLLFSVWLWSPLPRPRRWPWRKHGPRRWAQALRRWIWDMGAPLWLDGLCLLHGKSQTKMDCSSFSHMFTGLVEGKNETRKPYISWGKPWFPVKRVPSTIWTNMETMNGNRHHVFFW